MFCTRVRYHNTNLIHFIQYVDVRNTINVEFHWFTLIVADRWRHRRRIEWLNRAIVCLSWFLQVRERIFEIHPQLQPNH